MNTRHGRLVGVPRQRLHGLDANVPFVVGDGPNELLHRLCRRKLSQRAHRGLTHVGVFTCQHLAQRLDDVVKFEALGELRGSEKSRAIRTLKDSCKLAGVRTGEPLRGPIQQLTHPLITHLGQPLQYPAQRLRPELAKQLSQIRFRGHRRCLNQ